MKVGNRAILEYRMATVHYWPGVITEVTPGRRIATIKLDKIPSILITDVLRVSTKHLFIRYSNHLGPSIC